MIKLENSQAIISKVLSIEAKLIKWCQEKKYSQGDYYSVRITNNGKWAVRYHNDEPKKFGKGKEYILTQEEFLEAMGKEIKPKTIRPKRVKVVQMLSSMPTASSATAIINTTGSGVQYGF